MAKRFTDTDKWERSWFRKLPSKYKLFWQFMLDKCDSAGVWYADIEIASFFIGEDFTESEVKEVFSKQIEVKNGRWLIKDFIEFQYGNLTEKNKMFSNVHLKLEKYHGGSIPHISPINGVKVKVKDKVEVKVKEKKKKFGEFNHVLLTESQHDHLMNKYGDKFLNKIIKELDEGIELKGYKYQNHSLALQKWAKNTTLTKENKYFDPKAQSKDYRRDNDDFNKKLESWKKEQVSPA